MKSISGCEYKLAKVLGKGTYGTVYEAIRKKDGKVFAYKSFQNYNEDLELGIIREISSLTILKGNKHHIVNLVDIIMDDDNFGIILPKLKQDLSNMIGNLSPRQRKNIAKQLLIASAYMHENGIIHRDIKPENILLDEKNNAFLADFTLAKAFRGVCTEGTHTGKIVTETYRAPEVLAKKPYTLSIDAWSIGVTLYEMFKGKNVPTKTDEKTIKYLTGRKLKNTPLGNMIRGLLEHDPQKRWTPLQCLQSEYFNLDISFKAQWQPTLEIKDDINEDIEEACEEFNIEKTITKWAAQNYMIMTGCSAFDAVAVACKVYELELISVDDEDFPEEEIEIFRKMGYNLFI